MNSFPGLIFLATVFSIAIMSSKKVFIAVDWGTGSGRVIAGKTGFSKLELEEIHRFNPRSLKQSQAEPIQTISL